MASIPDFDEMIKKQVFGSIGDVRSGGRIVFSLAEVGIRIGVVRPP